MKIATLILAAGSSSRMQHPKQLLPVGDTFLLGKAITVALALKTDSVHVVLGANANAIAEQLKPFQVSVIHNPDYKTGLSSSIVSGIKQLKDYDAVLVLLADQPYVDEAYLKDMLLAFKKHPDYIIASAYKNSKGVPAIFPKHYFSTLEHMEGDKGAKLVLNSDEISVHTIDTKVNLFDVDTPEDYHKLTRHMISFNDAIKHVETYSTPLKTRKKAIAKAVGHVLAEDVISPINMPPFKQSAMDGYAIIHSNQTEFTVIGEVPAGSSKTVAVKAGEAVRIFTGARVPDATDTVVMQEHTERTNDGIEVQQLPEKLSNVRPMGEQIQQGDMALAKGTVLNAAAVGFLAGLGIPKVKVYKQPKVTILITGNELKPIGKPLNEGEIYESNSITLQLALKNIGVRKVNVVRVKDALKPTKSAIKAALNTSDVVLVSGGISVGDYDFVKQALDANNVKEVFYKVNQKPGKPLWFGYKGNTKVFALPGNPASSLSCFYVYVLPLIKAQMGYTNTHLEQAKAKVTETIKNPFGKTLFLKGIVTNGNATQLTGQASSMLRSFAIANALLIVPSHKTVIKKGQNITYLKLDD